MGFFKGKLINKLEDKTNENMENILKKYIETMKFFNCSKTLFKTLKNQQYRTTLKKKSELICMLFDVELDGSIYLEKKSKLTIYCQIFKKQYFSA